MDFCRQLMLCLLQSRNFSLQFTVVDAPLFIFICLLLALFINTRVLNKVQTKSLSLFI